MISRQLIRAARAPLVQPHVFSASGAVRRYAVTEGEHAKTSDTKPKLTFRIPLKNVPVELYPLGVVVFACVCGGGFALTKIFMSDPELLHHRSVGAREEGFKLPEEEKK